MLPEIVYNIKKKLGCIFVDNHNSKPIGLKRGKTIGLVMSCIVSQEEQVTQCKTYRERVMTWTLIYLHRLILSVNKLVEWDYEVGEVPMD